MSNPLSPEARAKISAKLKGRFLSAETRAKMSAARTGKKLGPKTPEQRAKLSAALKGRPLPEDAPQRKKGRKLSEETKAKLRGKPRSQETRDKISATLTKQLSSLEARAAVSERMKRKISDAAREKMRALAPFYYKGGKTAEAFAAVLCPAGFIREHRLQWSDYGYDYFRLDFAHLEGKVCIELDGPHHDKTQELRRSA